MPKMLIDLSTDDAAKLRNLAAEHGHKVKPFVEYLVRMQVGSVPPPSARPVNLAEDTPKEKPERIPTKEARTEAPAKDTQPEHTEEQTGKSALIAARPQEHRTEAPTKDRTQGTDKAPEQEAPISKNVAEYTERIGSGIYSNGTHYTLNKFGKRTFHRTLQEAQAAAQ
jgi:hypothetical protein